MKRSQTKGKSVTKKLDQGRKSVNALIQQFPHLYALDAEHAEFLRGLLGELVPHYLPRHFGGSCIGSHDINHVYEMANCYSRFAKALAPSPRNPSLYHFLVMVVLHNLDKVGSMSERLKGSGTLEEYLWDKLANSHIPDGEITMIVEAVLEHSKLNRLMDSVYLKWLRMADRMVRFSLRGMLAIAIHRGQSSVIYNPLNPFEYADAPDGASAAVQGVTVLGDDLRVVEWLGMTTPDMEPIIREYNGPIRLFLTLFRQLCAEVVRETGCPNRAEECLRKALGHLYPVYDHE